MECEMILPGYPSLIALTKNGAGRLGLWEFILD
jgi:hypothetical protein